jgi:hypothetical protein
MSIIQELLNCLSSVLAYYLLKNLSVAAQIIKEQAASAVMLIIIYQFPVQQKDVVDLIWLSQQALADL